MIGGLVEIADSGRHLSAYRGFLKVSEGTTEIGRVALEDIDALILSGPQITLTKSLLARLAKQNSIIVVCGENWHPLSMTLPYSGHYESAGILQDQIQTSRPLQKRLWQQVVKAKLLNQQRVLHLAGARPEAVRELEIFGRRVRSGDPDNIEAQAARVYWPALMGSDFRRRRDGATENAFLNYGYTILRAAMARAVCGTGLNPALGLHHRSRVNAFALVDDLMEPFRPLVDMLVRTRLLDKAESLGPPEKRLIAAILQEDMIGDHGHTPAVNGMARLAQSLSASLKKREAGLSIAEIRPHGQMI